MSSLTAVMISVPCLVRQEKDRRGVAGRDGLTAGDGREAGGRGSETALLSSTVGGIAQSARDDTVNIVMHANSGRRGGAIKE